MAATASPSSSFSSLCTKISNLSFTHSSTPIQTHFPAKPISLKPFKISNFSSLSVPSFPHFRTSSALFDGIEVSQETNTQEQENPELDSSEREIEVEEEEEEEERKGLRSSEEGRLYVGNLPYSMTSSQLSEVFSEAGRVVSVEVVYDRVTDRSRGFAFVSMGSVEEAKEAIQMFNGSQVGGRTVKVNFPEVPRGGEREVMGPKIRSNFGSFIDSPHKIYAGNLSWSLTSQSLRDAFANQPGILSAKVIYERATGKSRGYGFVSFETAEDADSALNSMNGADVDGRPLRLKTASERAPLASPPTYERETENSLDSSDLLSSISA